MTRTRSVIRQNKNEGKSCPPIEQTKLGKKKHFVQLLFNFTVSEQFYEDNLSKSLNFIVWITCVDCTGHAKTKMSGKFV